MPAPVECALLSIGIQRGKNAGERKDRDQKSEDEKTEIRDQKSEIGWDKYYAGMLG